MQIELVHTEMRWQGCGAAWIADMADAMCVALLMSLSMLGRSSCKCD